MACLYVALFPQANENKVRYLTAQPTHIEAWGFNSKNNLSPELETNVDEPTCKPHQGAIISCIDGSLYIFQSNLAKAVKPLSEKRRHTSNGEHLHPTLPYRRPHLSFSRSRNSSPSRSLTNIAVTSSKSRAVSGLTREKVEAPRNFVDFEDEQERMKGMIAERTVKEMKDRFHRPSLTPPPPHVQASQSDDANSVVSIASSSSLLSPPLSPTLGPSNESSELTHPGAISLKIRVVGIETGPENPLVSLKLLHKEELFLTLHGSGKVSLYKTDDGICINSISPGTTPFRNARVMSHGYKSQILWTWCACQVNQSEDMILIAAIARASDTTVGLDSGESDDKTRVVLYEIPLVSSCSFSQNSFSRIGDYMFKGRAENLAVSMSDDKIIKINQVDESGVFSVRTVTRDTQDVSVSFQASSQLGQPASLPNIPLPQQLRNLVARSGQSSPIHEGSRECLNSETQLDPVTWELPLSNSCRGLYVQRVRMLNIGVAWSLSELIVFYLQEEGIDIKCAFPVSSNLIDVRLLDADTIRLRLPDRVDTYYLPNVGLNEHKSYHDKSHHLSTGLISSVALQSTNIVCLGCSVSDPLIYVTVGTDTQNISILKPSIKDSQNPKSNCLWSIKPEESRSKHRIPRVTSILPIGLSLALVGSCDGDLRTLSLDKLLSAQLYEENCNAKMIQFAPLSLELIYNKSIGKELVIAGGDDGSINIWDLNTLKLHARWVIFTEPLQGVFQVEKEIGGRLRECCLCVSMDGTVAVIELDGYNFLFLVPGSPARLQTICLSSDNLMLLYIDGRTRLWDIKNKEFWRSMDSEKASEMLEQGGWSIINVENDSNGSSRSIVFAINRSSVRGDPPPAYVLEVQSIIESFHSSQVTIEDLVTILATLLVPGIDEQLDCLVSNLTRGAHRYTNILNGSYDNFSSYQIFAVESPHDLWKISQDTTAARLLIIVSILRVLVNFSAMEGPANAVMSFYTSELPAAIGSGYLSPSLPVLAYYWNTSTVSDVRLAAKHLFENEATRLSSECILPIIDRWRHELPCLLPGDEKQSPHAALALCICGNIAIERYNLLSSNTLSDVAKSVMIYFNDDTSPHRTLAIELCSRGFEIWQQYFDAMEALRSLFMLATTSKKEAINIRNPGPQARLAVLHIASSNSPLFMTTLSLDILHPHSIEYSKSVLQIIAFLIRKKPLVLFPNLPRLMEAVVKSLDPGSNANREAVQDSVTDIIALVVQTFPTLDFHAGSQRLAVGTNEGAVILYDLKTATRLYVLEGHRRRLTGISFSPDGRRMVTLSVEESLVLVWKVGSSFSSFFNPGAPPRQGRSGSEPYKSLNFVLQDRSSLSIEDSLKQVNFEWPSDRSVRVQIRDTTFTFSA